MANRAPQDLHPLPRSSSRAPGIFVNVEFGVSFSNNRRPHTAALNYTSKSMAEKLARQQRQQQQQQQEEHYLQQRDHHHSYVEPAQEGAYPSTLMPGTGYHNGRQTRDPQGYHRPPRSLNVRTTQHERGSSAPPSFTDRALPLSPGSPLAAIQHTSSFPLSATERPLPPAPSRFRLGEDDLPWSTEPWYIPEGPDDHDVPAPSIEANLLGFESENARGEDPQRVADLQALHQAMATVDSLDHEGWEAWAWDSVGGIPGGPTSLGWAVRSDEPRAVALAPPPYVVSQFEEALMRNSNLRPRSSG